MTLEEANQTGNSYARRIQACLKTFQCKLGDLVSYEVHGEQVKFNMVTERKIAVYYLQLMGVNTHIISTALNVYKWDIIKYVEAISKSIHEDPRMADIFGRIENEFQLLNQKTA